MYYSKRNLYYDHVIFALHFICFFIYALFLILPVLILAGWVVLRLAGVDVPDVNVNHPVLQNLLLALIFTYLLISGRRYYRQKYVWTIPKILLLVVAVIAMTLSYRFILFCITLYMV